MSLDQAFFAVGISAYVVGALALITYFLGRVEWAKKVGIPFAIIGCVSQFAELGTRWATSHIWPLTNLYGSLSLFAAMSVAMFLAFSFRYDLWFIGGWVQMLAAIAFGYASTWNEGYMPPVPALQSYWIKIHVPLVISAYASFMVAFVVSALYLVKYYFEQRIGRGRTTLARVQTAGGPPVDVALPGRTVDRYAGLSEPGVAVVGRAGDTPNIARAASAGDALGLWLSTLPTLSKLDIISYRIISVGLPLLTVGIITGAWWAKEAWGAYWQWDPKETAALLSWIVYASFMHLHTRNAWRGMRTAWVSVLGFASIMFCYLGVNIWISGLHSYKM